ncbi:ferritin-like domain-containing protein [Chitinophaga sp. 22321]|uniref:Ferritin-like domain-containing protein n=1 Tax=Chitinophaga hostae TaxID=2831022 RepID=A0ABS5J5Y5_9BACT|nr:ferritin-like domain-containing protein [Chitinophaga hostae]MBS0029987.1 ferritin-like domain-containing protein [Chitinophaga hostae]
MNPSKKWIGHFTLNALQQRVDWQISPALSDFERKTILRSLQAWQLGETSDGAHLIRAAKKYAAQNDDPDYVAAVELFIKEEQKHGNNLGRYLDAIGEQKIQQDWGDTLFRKVRYFNTNMEIWTVAVIVVESAAQIFYQSLKDATCCTLLKQICTDILIDEADHIRFQQERLSIIFHSKGPNSKIICNHIYQAFFLFTTCLVWLGHKAVFKAGGNTFHSFMRKMKYKYVKIFHRSLQVNGSNNALALFHHN